MKRSWNIPICAKVLFLDSTQWTNFRLFSIGFACHCHPQLAHVHQVLRYFVVNMKCFQISSPLASSLMLRMSCWIIFYLLYFCLVSMISKDRYYIFLVDSSFPCIRVIMSRLQSISPHIFLFHYLICSEHSILIKLEERKTVYATTSRECYLQTQAWNIIHWGLISKLDTNIKIDSLSNFWVAQHYFVWKHLFLRRNDRLL